MSDFEQTERLLSDVLGEDTEAGFREGLLKETLRLARRRRGFRQLGKSASLLVVLAGLGLLVWHQFPSVRIPASLPAKPYVMVRTQPLSPAALVKTRPLPPASLVTSVRTGNIVVTAAAASPVREVNDDELLSLAPQPAALVRFGPHNAELVFVDSANREALQQN
jgi:hypothetical protein